MQGVSSMITCILWGCLPNSINFPSIICRASTSDAWRGRSRRGLQAVQVPWVQSLQVAMTTFIPLAMFCMYTASTVTPELESSAIMTGYTLKVHTYIRSAAAPSTINLGWSSTVTKCRLPNSWNSSNLCLSLLNIYVILCALCGVLFAYGCH